MTANAPLSQKKIISIIGALMLGMLLAALDGSIVSTALPTIVGDLHGANHISWVVVSYLLASTVTTPLWGKLGDLHGRKLYFIAAILVFLAGSALCGAATSMTSLIFFRGLQGLGGGGLMVGAQAVMADIVSPAERGKYSGFFGGVWGASTVLGPLLGGFIVDHLSWRWIFYVNLPVGAVALAMCVALLPRSTTRREHVIDYAGVLTLVASSSALILFTSLGGNTIAWRSGWSYFLVVTAIVMGFAFVLIERRSREPVLPPHLFANRVFSSASSIGFVTGFAMFGSTTFLPLFFQYVNGDSPTGSGLRLAPMMVGVFVCSVTVGQLISRGWRYRPFPIAGTLVMTLGLFFFSRLTVNTTTLTVTGFMLILGAGMGLVMQVLITSVQNAVPMEDMGAATAGANFFRSMGGSFGTAVFGALYANDLPRAVVSHLRAAHLAPHGGLDTLHSLTPQIVRHMPAAYRNAITSSVADAVTHIFVWAIPVGVVAFVISLTLPEVAMRRTLHPIADEIPMSNSEPLT
jgi:EmrB/QacA subfamily drug resistance transporter